MPWVVGIDEAGYGPNLGPLVQAAVALHLPDDDLGGWKTLKATVRRAHEDDDGRLLIDDSKKVYAGGDGLHLLERGVFAADGRRRVGLGKFLTPLCIAECLDDLAREPWYESNHRLPWTDHETSWPGPTPVRMSVRLTPTPAFNRTVDDSGSKAAAVMQGVIDFLRTVPGGMPDGEPILFACDKLGGRNFYGALLSAAFPDGWPVAEKETAAESRYRILNLDREVTVTFRPRADGESVCVALASMLAKYLREVCMKQFNAFWAKHVPGIQPTAGYPGDARRFYDEIRPAMDALGLEPDAVWRKR
jgi:ribonuclease HII